MGRRTAPGSGDATARCPRPSASMYVALRASQATRPLTRAGSPCRSCSRGAGCGCCSSFGSAFLAFAPFCLFPLPGFNVVSDSLADPVRLHPQLLDAPERVSARHRQHPFQTLTEPVEPRPLRRLEATAGERQRGACGGNAQARMSRPADDRERASPATGAAGVRRALQPRATAPGARTVGSGRPAATVTAPERGPSRGSADPGRAASRVRASRRVTIRADDIFW